MGHLGRKAQQTVEICLLLSLISACTQMGLRTWSDMSHTEKATWFMGIYNAQYDDYQMAADRSGLTEEQKKILGGKKLVLTEIYPLIQAYNAYIDSQVAPPEDLEENLLNLTNNLLEGAL